MKKDKDKSKKGHENTIGKIIYGLLLFLPLLAIGVTCAYAVFNKNAYQSYQTENVRTIQNVQNIQMFVDSNTYEWNTESFIQESPNINEYYGSGKIAFKNATIDFHDYVKDSTLPTNLNVIAFRFAKMTNTNQEYRLYLWLDNGTDIMSYSKNDFKNNNNVIPQFTFTYLTEGSSTNYFEQTKALNMILWQNSKVGNVFYDSISKIEQSDLLNWTKNSLIYTGMSEFTNQLSITNTFIPMLLTYWLIISVVYFLYDIILVILTVLHRKIHNLQESI